MVVTLDLFACALNPEIRAFRRSCCKSAIRGQRAVGTPFVGGWVWEEPAADGGDRMETLGDAVTRIHKGQGWLLAKSSGEAPLRKEA